MQKRKIYWLATGVVLAQMSMATQVSSFKNDCPDCSAQKMAVPASQTPMPIGQNFMNKLNGFVNGVTNGPMGPLMSSQAAAVQAPAVPKEPVMNLHPPGDVVLTRTKMQVDALMGRPIYDPVAHYIGPYKTFSDYQRFESGYVNQNAFYWNGSLYPFR